MITVSPADDGAPGGFVVRPGCMVGSTGNDGVVAAVVGAVEPHPVFEFVADVGLGDRAVDRGEQDRLHLGERRIGECRGGGDPLDLGVVLDLTLETDERHHRLERDVRGESRPLGVVQRCGIECDGPDRRQRLDQAVVQFRSARLGDHGGAARRGFGASTLAVAPVGAEDQVVGGEHRPAVRPGEPGEPSHIDEVGEQQRITSIAEPATSVCSIATRAA